jgi:hypothetical protein
MKGKLAETSKVEALNSHDCQYVKQHKNQKTLKLLKTRIETMFGGLFLE